MAICSASERAWRLNLNVSNACSIHELISVPLSRLLSSQLPLLPPLLLQNWWFCLVLAERSCAPTDAQGSVDRRRHAETEREELQLLRYSTRWQVVRGARKCAEWRSKHGSIAADGAFSGDAWTVSTTASAGRRGHRSADVSTGGLYARPVASSR